jgi:hypothetical protein
MKIFLDRLIIGSILILTFFVLQSCEEEAEPPLTNAGYSQGVFIMNEGPFQTGTGTVTYMRRDGTGKVESVFQKSNTGLVLGNIVQSMNVDPQNLNRAYIAVNNANKIVVVDVRTFNREEQILNIELPRYIEFGLNQKAYISCWDNTVKIISTVGYEFFGQVSVGTGPEKMKRIGNQIWVLNKGGLAVDSTISIINTGNDQLVTTLEVYPKPTGIEVDENGMVWVLCSGKGWNGFPDPTDSEAHLLCIDPSDFSFVMDLPFPGTTEHPEDLAINKEGNLLFYTLPDGIYRFDIHGVELEESPFIERSPMFYGLGCDPVSNVLYASDPVDYVQQGWIYRYDVFSGSLQDSIRAGIIPGEFYFSSLSETGKK